MNEAIECLKNVQGIRPFDEIFYLDYLIRGAARRIFLTKSSRRGSCTPRRDVIVRVLSHCNSLFYCPKKMDAIFWILPFHEPDTWNFMSNNIGQGDIFVDVGAYVGVYSVTMAKLVGQTGKVFAIEPSPSIHLLKRNLNLNNLDNVEVINKAAYSKKGDFPFIYEEVASHSHLSENGSINVETDTLDDMILPYLGKAEKIKCLKIDVEGAEMEVLKGANQLLKRVKYVMIEVEEETEKSVKQYLKDADLFFMRNFERGKDIAGKLRYNILFLK